MTLTRRFFSKALSGLLAAPAVVSFSSIMPVKALPAAPLYVPRDFVRLDPIHGGAYSGGRFLLTEQEAIALLRRSVEPVVLAPSRYTRDPTLRADLEAGLADYFQDNFPAQID